jgi:hypothetical protein
MQQSLTRAAALRARRTALARKAPWPVSIDGPSALRGIGGVAAASVRVKGSKKPDPEDDEAYPPYANDADPWKAHFAGACHITGSGRNGICQMSLAMPLHPQLRATWRTPQLGGAGAFGRQ